MRLLFLQVKTSVCACEGPNAACPQQCMRLYSLIMAASNMIYCICHQNGIARSIYCKQITLWKHRSRAGQHMHAESAPATPECALAFQVRRTQFDSLTVLHFS